MNKEYLPEILDKNELKRLVRLAYRGNTESMEYLFQLAASKQEYQEIVEALIIEMQRKELKALGLKSDTSPSGPEFTERWLSNYGGGGGHGRPK